MNKKNVYTADFETTSDENDCRVWLWGVCDVYDTDRRHFGTTIEGFIDYVRILAPCTIYFTNLGFDGKFIIDNLYAQGYKYTEDKAIHENEFCTLISDLGQFYNIRVCTSENKSHKTEIEFRDSMKLIPLGVADMANAFGLEEHKIEEPDDYYTKERPYGYEPTQEDIDYITGDIIIPAKCLRQMFDLGFDKMTIGANALAFFKKICKGFDRIFCDISDYDADIRRSYKGGWVYANPDIVDEEQGEGLVLDVNSLFPWAMRNCPMPVGHGIYFKGQYPGNHPDYPLYIQQFRAQFELKPGKLPMIQLKHTRGFVPTEYVTDTGYESVCLTLTNVDLKLFLENYDVYNIEYIDGWMFRAETGIFDKYIDYWTNVKIEADRTGNKGMRQIAKLFLNNLYGKFSTAPTASRKIPYYEDGVVKYRITEPEERNTVYLPVGTFITSYAREKTIRTAQLFGDRFWYSDTDSLHVKGTEIPEGVEVDPYKLGAWKIEAIIKRGKYLRAKCYCEEISEDGGKTYRTKTTVAGLPKKLHSQIGFDKFDMGVEYQDKLEPKVVKGGVILTKTKFKIQ